MSFLMRFYLNYYLKMIDLKVYKNTKFDYANFLLSIISWFYLLLSFLAFIDSEVIVSCLFIIKFIGFRYLLYLNYTCGAYFNTENNAIRIDLYNLILSSWQSKDIKLFKIKLLFNYLHEYRHYLQYNTKMYNKYKHEFDNYVSSSTDSNNIIYAKQKIEIDANNYACKKIVFILNEKELQNYKYSKVYFKEIKDKILLSKKRKNNA